MQLQQHYRPDRIADAVQGVFPTFQGANRPEAPATPARMPAGLSAQLEPLHQPGPKRIQLFLSNFLAAFGNQFSFDLRRIRIHRAPGSMPEVFVITACAGTFSGHTNGNDLAGLPPIPSLTGVQPRDLPTQPGQLRQVARNPLCGPELQIHPRIRNSTCHDEHGNGPNRYLATGSMFSDGKKQCNQSGQQYNRDYRDERNDREPTSPFKTGGSRAEEIGQRNRPQQDGQHRQSPVQGQRYG